MKFVALVQIPLILVAVAVYAYVLVSLRPLLQQREALKQEIDSLMKSVTVLREESYTYRTSLQQAPALPETPITALIKPQAARRQTDRPMSDGRPAYEFSAWIGGPKNVMERIKAVQYEFNHPTFRDPVMHSGNRESGFRVSYIGWGCLSSVIVTLTLVEPKGEPPRLDFDMCAAIDSQ